MIFISIILAVTLIAVTALEVVDRRNNKAMLAVIDDIFSK